MMSIEYNHFLTVFEIKCFVFTVRYISRAQQRTEKSKVQARQRYNPGWENLMHWLM